MPNLGLVFMVIRGFKILDFRFLYRTLVAKLQKLPYTLTDFHFHFLNNQIPTTAIKISANVIAKKTPIGPKSNVIAITYANGN